MHQVGFAQADAAVQEQRIEPGAGRPFRDAAGAGIGEFVRFADDETFEGEARIERRGEVRTRLDTLVRHPVIAAMPELLRLRSTFGDWRGGFYAGRRWRLHFARCFARRRAGWLPSTATAGCSRPSAPTRISTRRTDGFSACHSARIRSP